LKFETLLCGGVFLREESDPMTVSVPSQLIYAYSGDGSVQVFAYPLRFLADSELVVILQDTDGNQVQQTLGVDYTVSDAGEDAGGSVTMLTAPATGEKLYIFRDTSPTQSLDLEDAVRTPAQSVEDQLDRLTMVEQDHVGLLKRAVKIQVGSSLSEGPVLPEPKDGEFLYWEGDKLANHSLDGGLGNVVGPDASTDGEIVVMSGTSGKVIEGSGKKLSDFANAVQSDDLNDLIASYLTSLPTSLPDTAGVLWNNGGVLSIS